MKTIINIDNYQEIMFRLVEDDFAPETREDLLQQIEADELFRFEWQSWQKTTISDPITNYFAESRELAGKIAGIAENDHSRRKMAVLFFSIAAVFTVLLGIYLFFANIHSDPGPGLLTGSEKPANLLRPATTAVERPMPVTRKSSNYHRHIYVFNQSIDSVPVVTDTFSRTVEPVFVEMPVMTDTVSLSAIPPKEAVTKIPRYKVTVETVQLADNEYPVKESPRHSKLIFSKLFTNTQFLLKRKPDGVPDRLILLGDDNNYVCINLNY